MPTYDYVCPCGWKGERIVPYARRDATLCHCGNQLIRIWSNRAPAMRPDSIPGGTLIENLTPTPKRFYSRTEIKDAMRAKGVESYVRHVGVNGTDKSPHTTRWTSCPPMTKAQLAGRPEESQEEPKENT